MKDEPLPLSTAIRNYHILGDDEVWWGSYVKACIRAGQPRPPHPKLKSI